MVPKIPKSTNTKKENAFILFNSSTTENDPFHDDFELKINSLEDIQYSSGKDGVVESDFDWIDGWNHDKWIKYQEALQKDAVINQKNKVIIVHLNQSNLTNFKKACTDPLEYS